MKKRSTWVQLEREACEAIARLSARSPKAAGLLHLLISLMNRRNAVVVAQKVLADRMGCSAETIKRAIKLLKDDNWLHVLKLNGPGSICAYVVNDRVAWCDSRKNLKYSTFSAEVIALAQDQDEHTLKQSLQCIPPKKGEQ